MDPLSGTCRRRRGRLRDSGFGFGSGSGFGSGGGSGGGSGPRIHGWSWLSPRSSPPHGGATLSSNYEAERSSTGARNGQGVIERTGDVLVLDRGGEGEGSYRQHPPARRNRRQRRRRQRLRLRAFGEVEVEVAEARSGSGPESGVASTIAGAGSLGIEAVVVGLEKDTPLGAAAAGSAGSDFSGSEAASGEFGSGSGSGSGSSSSSGSGSPAVASSSGIGGWPLPEGVSHGPPPSPRATTAHEAGRQGCAGSAREQDRSSAGADGLRAEDDRFMRMALRLADRARMEGEVPIGAVLTETVASSGDGKRRVLSSGRNRVERRRDASAHAEMLCLQAAAKARHNWRLAGATLYVTMEPCVMCLSAAQLFRVDRVVYGAPNPNLGACGGWVDLSAQKHAFHDLEVRGGVLVEECATPLRGFFRSRRREGEVAPAAHPHLPADGAPAVGTPGVTR